MHLSAAKVALILAFVSAQVGAIPAPSPPERGVGSGSHGGGEGHQYGGNWQGGSGGMRGGHPGGNDGQQHGGAPGGRMGGSGGNEAGGHGGGNDGGFRGKHGPSPDEVEDITRRDMGGDGDKFRHGSGNFGGNGGGNGGGFHRGGMEYVRKPGGGGSDHGDGPMPEEEFDEGASSSAAPLERRHDFIQDGLAGWKWWQKQPAYGNMPAGNPNAGVIDMKDDPIFDRIPQKMKNKRDDGDDNEKRWGFFGSGGGDKGQQPPHRDGTQPPDQLDHTFHRDFSNDKPGKMIPKGQ